MGDSPKAAHEPVIPPVVEGRKRALSFDTRCEVVRHYDSLPNDGSIGAYLRRNGLFKSSVNNWRSDMVNGVTEVKRPGRKPVDSTERELARLRAETQRLERELQRANAIIDVQKKVSALLELHMESKESAS